VWRSEQGAKEESEDIGIQMLRLEERGEYTFSPCAFKPMHYYLPVRNSLEKLLETDVENQIHVII